MKSLQLPMIALLVAGVTAGQAAFAPRQSQAVVAVLSGGTAIPALIVLGAGALAAGGGAAIFVTEGSNEVNGKAAGAVLGVSGVLAILTGIVLLDESGAPTPDFQILTPAKAQEAGIAPRQMRGFNRQLDRINSVSESIARGIAQKKITDAQAALQYVHGEWVEARESNLISSDAFAALNALSAHSYQQLKAAK